MTNPLALLPDMQGGVVVVDVVTWVEALDRGAPMEVAIETAAIDGTMLSTWERQSDQVHRMLDSVRRHNGGGDYWKES